jgi:hypothetical protein
MFQAFKMGNQVRSPAERQGLVVLAVPQKRMQCCHGKKAARKTTNETIARGRSHTAQICVADRTAARFITKAGGNNPSLRYEPCRIGMQCDDAP